MRHLAILRFSALGDIAMTVPVVDCLARQYPDLRITVVSRPFVGPLFENLPQNVDFFPVDLRQDCVGLRGLWRLARQLKRHGVDAVADFHNVLRTIVIRRILQFHGLRVEHIDKGRAEKRRLVAHTSHGRLPSSFERYNKVLVALGLDVTLNFQRLALPASPLIEELLGSRGKSEYLLGIAPFAAHRGKIYPSEKLAEALALILEQRPGTRLFVFGTPREMDTIRKDWDDRFPRIVFVSDTVRGLGQELQLMAHLDAMISMDSANMHLASLVGCPVVSIWGQTHPDAGFMGWGQLGANIVQQELSCRPCSIFGNKPCRFGDYRCMQKISPNIIAAKVDEIFTGKKPKEIV